MDILYFIVMGIVQGILEWLPVSSEGVLLLIQNAWLYQSTLDLRLAIWLHLGTTLAVLIVYRKEWQRILFNYSEDVPERMYVILATIGTGVVGVPIEFFLTDLFDNPLITQVIYFIIGGALLITAALLFYSRAHADENIKPLNELSNWESFAMGCAQGLAIVPGISRSGTTVAALLLRKVEGEDAFRGSFLISVPAVLGATALDLLKVLLHPESTTTFNYFGAFIGIIFAFIFGIATIKILLYVARKIHFGYIAGLFGLLLIIIGFYI